MYKSRENHQEKGKIKAKAREIRNPVLSVSFDFIFQKRLLLMS